MGSFCRGDDPPEIRSKHFLFFILYLRRNRIRNTQKCNKPLCNAVEFVWPSVSINLDSLNDAVLSGAGEGTLTAHCDSDSQNSICEHFFGEFFGADHCALSFLLFSRAREKNKQ